MLVYTNHITGVLGPAAWNVHIRPYQSDLQTTRCSRVVAARVVGRTLLWVAVRMLGVCNYKCKPRVRPCIAVQVLKIHLHLCRCQKMLVISYTCPGISKALFERYSYNSITLPLPTRGNSHLGLKVLDCQFCSYGPLISCTVWSKAKYKILGKLRWDQLLLVSVVLCFVQLHLLLHLCLVNIHNVFGPHSNAYFTAHPPKDFARSPLLSRCIGKQALAIPNSF